MDIKYSGLHIDKVTGYFSLSTQYTRAEVNSK